MTVCVKAPNLKLVAAILLAAVVTTSMAATVSPMEDVEESREPVVMSTTAIAARFRFAAGGFWFATGGFWFATGRLTTAVAMTVATTENVIQPTGFGD